MSSPRRPLRRLFRVAGWCCAVVPLTSCVMPDQLARLQKDVADVQQTQRRIEQDQAALQARVRDVEGKSTDPERERALREVADLNLRVDQMGREDSIQTERLNELQRRIDGVAQEVQQVRDLVRRSALAAPTTPAGPTPAVDAPGVPSGSTSRPSPGAAPDPEALYNSAYSDFSKGNYSLAISGFEEYVEGFPESPLADNAVYWIAECHFSQGDFSSALARLDQLLERYPRSDKAAAANLKKALVFLEQNQVGQAIVQLRYVVATYPGSDEARLARDKLASLGAPA